MGGQSYSKEYWKPDSQYVACIKCKKAFTFTNRRHHCRSCGGVFCAQCCRRKAAVPTRGIHQDVRVCDTCYFNIVANNNGSASPSFQNPVSGGVGGPVSVNNGGAVGSFNRGSPINGSMPNAGDGVPSNLTGAYNQGNLAEVALPQRPSGNPTLDAAPTAGGAISATSRANRIAQSVNYVDCPLAPDPMDPSYYEIEVDDFPNQLNLAAEEEGMFSPPFPEPMSVAEVQQGQVANGTSGRDPTLTLFSAQDTQATGFNDFKLAAALNDVVHDLMEHGIPAQLQAAGGRNLIEEFDPSVA